MQPSNETVLNPEEKSRYARQIILSGFGLEGQIHLKNSRVLIVGAGGLGCPIGLYLAGAGVGHIAVLDHDQIELSNIHRQVAYRAADVGRSKAVALVDTINGINPGLSYEIKEEYLSAANARELLGGYDLVIDGTDNFATKFLVGDSCYFLRTPFLHGSVHRYIGQVILFTLADGPCLRCLYNKPPQLGALAACNEGGILGIAAGSIGILMATEAVKYLARLSDSQPNQLIQYDILNQSIQKISLKRDPACPLCASQPNNQILAEEGNSCMTKASNHALEHPSNDSITIAEAQTLLENGAFLLDVREPIEYEQMRLSDAFLIPLANLPQELAKNVPKDRPVVVYCQHGVRSLSAVHYMRAAGYKDSYSVTGGIAAWSAAEL